MVCRAASFSCIHTSKPMAASSRNCSLRLLTPLEALDEEGQHARGEVSRAVAEEQIAVFILANTIAKQRADDGSTGQLRADRCNSGCRRDHTCSTPYDGFTTSPAQQSRSALVRKRA